MGRTRRKGHYVARTADMICEYIAEGKTLQQALDKIGYVAPPIKYVWKWLENYPEFREKYERARKLQADQLADKMLELGQAVIQAPKAASAYKVATDVLKWHAEVRNRARFGSKAEDNTPKTMDPAKIRSEIARLEKELGIAETKVVPLRAVGGGEGNGSS